MAESKSHPVPYVLITRFFVERDAGPSGNKLGKVDNNGRKILATDVLPKFGEVEINDPLWHAPAVLPTGGGGLEVATFTEFAGQDRHKHGVSTEIYTVLKGRMLIYVNDEGPLELDAMDEVIIFPGTVHEVVQKKRRARESGEEFELLVRVHALNCYGVDDKFVQLEPNGEWHCWSKLSADDRKRAYKKQASS